MITAAAALILAAAASWEIDADNNLRWEGSLYRPIGVRIPGNPERIRASHEAGVTDLVVELPASGAGWDAAAEALRETKQTFLIQVSSAAPTAKGWAVEPGGYRRDGLDGPFQETFSLPSASDCFGLTAAKRDGAIRWEGRLPVNNGKVSVNLDIGGFEQVLLLYPNLDSVGMPDLWERLDLHRDTLLRSLARTDFGDGLRGVIDPMGQVVRLPAGTETVVPDTPLFRLELKEHLESVYRRIEPAREAWAIGANDIEDFDHLARLVPLWANQRGVQALYDPVQDKTYTVTIGRSAAWRDIQDVIKAASERRLTRLIEAVQTVKNVPVIQSWPGWDGPHRQTLIGLNGLSADIPAGTMLDRVESAAPAVSACLQWQKSSWPLAHRIGLDPGDLDGMSLNGMIARTESMGLRGWFLDGSHPQADQAAADLAAGRLTAPVPNKATPLFYPLAAHDPCFSIQIPGGRWWLPTDEPGTRIDFGSGFAGYSLEGRREKFVALWSLKGEQRTRLQGATVQEMTFRTLDGMNPQPRKRGKATVELTINDTPMIIPDAEEVPVPVDAWDKAKQDSAKILAKMGPTLPNAESYAFTLQNAIQSYEQGRGASLLAVLALRKELGALAAQYIWVEGEDIRDHSWSRRLLSEGASRGMALTLRSRLQTPALGQSARLQLVGKPGQVYQTWIAARMSREDAQKIVIRIGSQQLKVEAGPISPYGGGYGWYRFGETTLSDRASQVGVNVFSETAVDIDLDVLVLYPGQFQPRGPRPPLDWIDGITLDDPGTG